MRGRISLGRISEGDNSATVAHPKAPTASRTRCTAKAPGCRQGKFRPLSWKPNLSHEVIPPPHSLCCTVAGAPLDVTQRSRVL